MSYWLLKSEPGAWSWDDQKKVKTEPWDGVRNYQAQNNLKAMKFGDLCFFYHSVKEKRIVGIVKVVKEFYPDAKEPRFGQVDVAYVKDMTAPVSLKQIKKQPTLQNIPLIRQSRLSVMPLDKESWNLICEMGQTKV
ncbi:MAG: ubiquinol-cytochrome C reductase [Rickettsiales bacterium]|nr:ubiquinol-cytochrome C reductase [Rickettsiales bacterium]|tara:strand:+ start:33187 stop:33594 length:408 start_codon:yes stop_codon:yes gene_type:complete